MLRMSFLCSSLFMVFCMPVSAQNLVNNADFHIGVELWADTPPDLVIASDSADWMDDPGSGSAKITNSASGNYNAGVRQCVSDGIIGGDLYDFGARVRVPSGQSEVGNAYLLGFVYDQEDCAGSQIAWPSSNPVSSADTWVPLARGDFLMPAGGMSILFNLVVNKLTANGGSFVADFDGVYMVPDGTLFWNGFESGTMVPWSDSVSP